MESLDINFATPKYQEVAVSFQSQLHSRLTLPC